MECLVRHFDVRTINLPMVDLGFGGDLGKGEKIGDKSETMEVTKIDSLEDKEDAADGNEILVQDRGNYEQGDEVETGNKKLKSDGNGKSENTRHGIDLIGKKDEKSFFFKTAAPPTQMPGHTGFLTFCTLYPQV